MKKTLKLSGFTLIEALVLVVIMSFLVISVLGMYSLSIRIVKENRFRSQAVALAEEKLEIVKNLPYKDVGTVSGIPAGTIPQLENIVFNNSPYTVRTTIAYLDDPADGILGVDPSELSGTDYKKIRIEVSWTGPFGNKNISLVSNIAPKRNQDESETGTLSVLVFNASGQPVPQADVQINATIGTTTINISAQTNSLGTLIFPGAPPAQNAYSISATKAGYSTDKTCSIDAAGLACTASEGNPVPTKPHASVIAGELTEISFGIDLVSTLIIKTIRQAQPTPWIINTDGTNFDQDNPAMAVCENGNYIFTWRDYRQNDNPRIYGQMYDSNLNPLWSPDLAITTSNNQNNPDVIHDKNCNTYVVWNDDRNGNQDVYYEKFNTTPASEWGGAKKLSTTAESADQTFPQNVFGTTPPFEYIVWLDERDGNTDIYAQKINPNTGAPMWSPEIKVNVFNGSASIQNKPRLYIDPSEDLNFVWQDNRNGHNDIFAQKMDKNGNIIWGSDIKINSDSTATEQINPSFSISSSTPFYMHVVWQDQRNGNYDIYAEKYDSSGAKIWTNDIKINSDAGTAIQENPVITEDHDGNYYIVWQDSRNGTSDIYMQKINGDGNKLIAFDVRINSVTSGEQEHPDIYINAQGYLVVVYQDNSGGDYDIQAAVYGSDPETITPVSNVSLAITGAKRFGENPVIYKYNQNLSTNSSGDLTVNSMEWDNYTFTPSGYTLIKTEPDQPVLLNPNLTQNIFIILE